MWIKAAFLLLLLLPVLAAAQDPDRIPLSPVDPASVRGDIVAAGGHLSLDVVEAAAERFRAAGYTGRLSVIPTGSDFSLYCDWNTDDIDLFGSRFDMADDWDVACARNGLEPLRLTLGYEAVGLYVNAENTFLHELTLEQLRALLTTAETWADLDSAFPAERIGLLIPSDAGWLEVLVQGVLAGDEDALWERTSQVFGDDTPPERARGVEGDVHWATFFSTGEAAEYGEALRPVQVAGALPNAEAVAAGNYPLFRSAYLYVDAGLLNRRPQVGAFLSFLLADLASAAATGGLLPPGAVEQTENRLLLTEGVG